MVVASAADVIAWIIAVWILVAALIGVPVGLFFGIRWLVRALRSKTAGRSARRLGGALLQPYGPAEVGTSVEPTTREPARTDKAEAKAVRREQREHDSAVKAARKAVSRAEKDHTKTVRQAEKRLQEAQQHRLIGRLPGIALYDNRIEGPGGGGPLTPEVHATVDTAGNLAVSKRVTVTRLVGLGVVGGFLFQKKEKHDTRELYLLVEGSGWATMVKCQPEAGMEARQLAQQINVAGQSAAEWAEQRKNVIESAEEELKRARGNTAAIEESRRRLFALERPPLPVSPPREARPHQTRQQ